MAQQPAAPGAGLAPGLELVYASGADTQPAWRVDSLAQGVAHEGRKGCARIVLRTGAAAADARLLCRAGDTLLTWSPRVNRWVLQRPVGPGLTLEVARGAGGVTRVETTATGCDEVGAARVATVVTAIVTTDSTGRAVRRLRERYAPALATATWGVFEAPDGGSWRVEREFTLVALRYPPGAVVPAECEL